MEGYELHRKYLTDRQSEILQDLAVTLTGDNKQVVMSILKEFSKNRGLRQ